MPIESLCFNSLKNIHKICLLHSLISFKLQQPGTLVQFKNTKNTNKTLVVTFPITQYPGIVQMKQLRSHNNKRLFIPFPSTPHQHLRSIRIRRIQSTVRNLNITLHHDRLLLLSASDKPGSSAQLFARLDLDL